MSKRSKSKVAQPEPRKADIWIAGGYLVCGECGGLRGKGLQQAPHSYGCSRANLQPGVLTA